MVFFSSERFFCRNSVFEAALLCLELVSNFCSMFSWYGKSRLADIETGPQPFILSYNHILLTPLPVKAIKSRRVEEYKNTRVQEYKSTRVQQYNSTTVQQYKSTNVQEAI